MSPKSQKGLQAFMTLVFLCSGSVYKSFLWIQVATVAVETLCFWDTSRFVFTVTMENEGGLLSPPCSWKYLVSLGKLMTQPGNEPMMQFWMSIPSLGESWGYRAELWLFSAHEVRAVLACCPHFWIFKHSLGTSPNTCTHPLVHLFHVRSGRLPQSLQVLMFTLPKPLPQHTSWRLWNNLELVSETLQTSLHCVCYWKAKFKRSVAEWYCYFACKTFLQISQLFQQ